MVQRSSFRSILRLSRGRQLKLAIKRSEPDGSIDTNQMWVDKNGHRVGSKFLREMKTVIEKSRLKLWEAKTVTGKTCPSFGEQKTMTVLNQKNRRRQKTYIGFAQKFSRYGFPVTVLMKTCPRRCKTAIGFSSSPRPLKK